MTWANRITILRLLLTPVVIIGLLREAPVWPALVFIVAALTDFADGWVARWRKEKSLLGRYLDPVADKLLLSSSFLALAHIGRLPMWVFIVVFARDLLILIGWNVIQILTGRFFPAPRALGKATTLFQMLVLTVAILFPGTGWLSWLVGPMVVLTGLSMADYVWVGSKKLGELG